MIDIPVQPAASYAGMTRAGDLRRMLAEVEEQLGLAECNVESSFLCGELAEFRGYLEDELQEVSAHPS
jgi:hypothetical protein